ncbi:protein kinase domain-containing protein [Nannocystaceae bacterium ST9]
MTLRSIHPPLVRLDFSVDIATTSRKATRVALGPYVLIHRLGAGGMGEVWTARRSALGGAAKLMAIKTLLPDRASDPGARRMFLEEARLSMLLTNSNIVQVFDVGETNDGICYMAMELVDGIDLAQLTQHLRAQGAVLSPSAIAYVIGEILRALDYAHEFNHEGTRRTIVHRDISPHNVMLSVAGEVKLMDFGIARLASEETSGLFIKGKIRYMPPEQFHGESREPRVDLFAVGAILHELLDGNKFRGEALDEARLLGMCARGEVPRLSRGPIPDELDRLRRALLEPRPEDRISSARAALRLLNKWPGDPDARFEVEEAVRRITGRATHGEGDSDVTLPLKKVPTEVLTEVLDYALLDWTDERTSQQFARGSEATVPASIVALAKLPASTRRSTLATRIMGVTLFGLTTLSAVWASGAKLREAEPPIVRSDEPNPVVEPTTVRAPEPSPPAITQTPKSLESPVASPVVPIPVDPIPVSKAVESARLETLKPQPPKSKSKTPVTIVAPCVWAQIQIDGREYTIDRLVGSKTASAKIEPGEYEVAFRDDPEANWQAIGKITIPNSKAVRLEISTERTPRVVK